jgi:hypothetical protein
MCWTKSQLNQVFFKNLFFNKGCRAANLASNRRCPKKLKIPLTTNYNNLFPIALTNQIRDYSQAILLLWGQL